MNARLTSRSASLCAALLCCTAAHAVAHADPIGEPPPAALEDRRSAAVDRFVDQASDSFQHERYDDSVRALTQAYTLDPQPIFLFNMAQSFRRGQHLREALGTYRRFLAADPRSSLRAETAGYVKELVALIQKQDLLEAERKKPLWKKRWFWGVVAGATAAVGVGVGLGVGLGLRDDRTVLDLK